MNKLRKPSERQRLVWRISAEAPLGEFVDPAAKPDKAAEPPLSDEARREAHWMRSSHDLLNGLEVTETDPGELFEDLFKPPLPVDLARDARPSPPDIDHNQWMLRFAIRLAELDLQAEPREVIGLAKKLWPTKHHLPPEEVARLAHDHRWQL